MGTSSPCHPSGKDLYRKASDICGLMEHLLDMDSHPAVLGNFVWSIDLNERSEYLTFVAGKSMCMGIGDGTILL